MLKRKPRKTIRVRRAAEIIGCSSEAIRRGIIGLIYPGGVKPFTMFKLNPHVPTSPLLMFESELDEYLEKREAFTRSK